MSLQHFKRQLRTNQTDAESMLWYNLRAKRFCNFKFRRQVQIRKYIVDFVCHEHKLIIELDGGQHNETLIRLKDNVRTKVLESEGYNVIRFWNHDVLQNRDAVLDKIFTILSNPLSRATRDLSHKGRGEIMQ
ncbi:MAG: endonuclease domain-containing protein [Gammaproteobacteria bacterium]|nr:endonuclease domain-containing protein [Gammaproteobacteria bacterium]